MFLLKSEGKLVLNVVEVVDDFSRGGFEDMKLWFRSELKKGVPVGNHHASAGNVPFFFGFEYLSR